MQTQVADEVFKRLDSLAQTLGTTSQYLYATLAKKGLGLGIFAVLNLLVFIVSYIVMYRTWTSFKYEQNRNDDPTSQTVGNIVLAVAISFFTLVLFISACAHATDVVYLISPESYATERVIQLLGR